MRKGAILLFLILLLIPSVSATINIVGPQKNVFNLGDEITISGYLLRDESFTGFLKLELICGENKSQLPLTSISLIENERSLFPEDFTIPKITIRNSLIGTCNLEASLIQGSETIETITSSDFIISQTLEGNFQLDKSKIQVGEVLIIDGNVFKLDGKPTDGSAEIYFENNDTKFLIDIINFQDGSFEYKYTSTALPSGTFDIDITINDVFNNKEEFDNVASFILISDLLVTAKAVKSSIRPGETLKLSGEVKNILQELIEEGVIKFTFDGSSYKVDVKDGKFEKEIETGNTITSGKHSILINAEDKLGNKGSNRFDITINPINENVEGKIEKDIYKPNDVVFITPLVYDQSDAIIEEDVTIEIINPKKEQIFLEVTKSNKKIAYNLGQFALPGTYKVTISTNELDNDHTFEVESVIGVDISLENQTIKVHNIGNVEYTKPIKVDLNEFTIIRRVNLQPNLVEEIKLDEEVPTNKYNIIVTSGEIKKAFNDISITGKPKKSFNGIYIFLITVLLILFTYITIKKKKKNFKFKIEKSKHKHSVKKEKKVEKEKPGKNKFGMSNKDDLKDFRKRIVKEIKKTEEKSKGKKGEGNLFGMFD
tara:strand:- start:17574 stop:19367 length:1794 start_codon:yes stop_codon:yes gene_type:complete